jgi:prevent-host-death family protein
MKSVTFIAAKQHFDALLDAAQSEAVIIRRRNRDAMVIVSMEEYERIHDLDATEFQGLCERVAAKAYARGLNQTVLKQLLKN